MEKIPAIGQDLTVKQIVVACREHAVVKLSPKSRETVLASRKVADDLVAEKKVVYGTMTGFGKSSDIVTSTDECHELRKNLIITYMIGAGGPFPGGVAHGILLLRVSSLPEGYSSIRLETLETMVMMPNKDVTPLIPEKGSLGASGNLAPLSHMVLVALGLGKAYYQGEPLSGAETMKRTDIPIVELLAKEGLTLNNGIQVMTSVGTFALHDATQFLRIADIADALCSEAQSGVVDALKNRVYTIRPHEDQGKTTKNPRRLLVDSRNITRQGEIRVQDAYLLCCSPRIHGASKDTVKYVQGRVDIEINSVTDNPLISKKGRTGISDGNFHGQPMALPFDFLKIVETELANVSGHRIGRLVNPAYSALLAFLTPHGGVYSGFMIMQYSAAAPVSENKVLAHPVNVDSIPSSAGQGDRVSMGTITARQAAEIGKNVRRVLATEFMVVYQGVDMRGNKGLGCGTQAAYDPVRKDYAYLDDDRELYEDINHCGRTLTGDSLIRAVETTIGGGLGV